ncbi:MAG: hypothetical protein BWY21_01879 [Parcubacteria group bacterium ADurb.Bin216]|nr:MAG: hypothetical protein BWY21_01879 [Parcubacteria group bacterium ADurb.Bin216]
MEYPNNPTLEALQETSVPPLIPAQVQLTTSPGLGNSTEGELPVEHKVSEEKELSEKAYPYHLPFHKFHLSSCLQNKKQ